MKKHSNQDNRKLKLNKIKQAKKRKNKARIKQRLRDKTVIPAPVPISFALYKTSAMLAGLLAVISYLFLFNPVAPIRADQLENYKNIQTFSATETSYIPPGYPDAELVFKNAYPASDGEAYEQIRAIVKNSPMEKMAALISQRDRTVAAFMVGIAMKESKFGRYSPKKNGLECYNYWGYRGKENTTQSGYSCFQSPEEAVKVVGDRIEKLVKNGLRTPAQMIVWKCGSTCAGHSEESVAKWIKDVSIHYNELTRPIVLAKNSVK